MYIYVYNYLFMYTYIYTMQNVRLRCRPTRRAALAAPHHQYPQAARQHRPFGAKE